jgi:hypothetical protein
MRGISTRRNPIATLRDFRRRVQGKITCKELGRRLAFHEGGDLNASCMGHAIKKVR